MTDTINKNDGTLKEKLQKKRIKHLLSIRDLKSYRQTIVTEQEVFPEYFTKLIELFRPEQVAISKEHNPEKKQALIDFTQNQINQFKNIDVTLKKDLSQDPKKFSSYIASIFTKENYYLRFLTDVGVLPNKTFLAEASRKIGQKILPAYNSSNSLIGLVEKTFYKKNDYQWVNELSREKFLDLFEVLGFQPLCELDKTHTFVDQCLEALGILSFRIATIAIEPEIIEREPDIELLESPFFLQKEELDIFIKEFKNNTKFNRTTQNSVYQNIIAHLDTCEEKIRLIESKRNVYGITLDITYHLRRLHDNIDRLKDLLALLLKPTKTENYLVFEKEINFFKKIIQAHCQKNQLTGYIQQNVRLYALMLTEKASSKGTHYITESPKEYFMMFFSALIGGFVVGFLSIFKSLAGALKISDFGKAFFYSINYSFGFMTIHLLGGTLATKQPAVTASTFAEKLQSQNQDFFGKFIAQFARSQLIAVLGNVCIAFPVAYFAAYYYYELTAQHVVGVEKAHHLIEDMHPLFSPALLHAGVAGIYLFAAGLIAGYHDNWIISNRIGERIRENTFLQRRFSYKRRNRMANFVEKNTGALAGNFYLGILLGSTGLFFIWVGNFINLPLPIDIRHITFAAGNLGLSLVALENEIEMDVLIVTILGIIGMGAVNILVSFSLSLTVAISSRKMSAEKAGDDFKLSVFQGFMLGFRYFFRRPFEFIFPPLFSRK